MVLHRVQGRSPLIPDIMSSSDADMWYWRKMRADQAISRFAPETPHIVADHAATGVAFNEISPTEFECLIRQGCKPLVAVDILKPV